MSLIDLDKISEKWYFIWQLNQQIIFQKRLPFDVKLPSTRPVDLSALSEAELNTELEKGYADLQAGRAKEASVVFADIRKDYQPWLANQNYGLSGQGYS